MTRLFRPALCLLGLPVLALVVLAEAFTGGFRRSHILAAVLLRSKRWQPWRGLMDRRLMAGCGTVCEDIYWLAFPAEVADDALWASGFHAIPADDLLTRVDLSQLPDSDVRLVRDAVSRARTAHPGCAIFLATADVPTRKALRPPPE